MNHRLLLLWLLVKISYFNFVQNKAVWDMGKCPLPRANWKWREYNLLGVKIAAGNYYEASSQCTYINVTKTAIKNEYIFEKVTRIYNTSHMEWKIKDKGLLRVRNDTYSFYGRLELPFRSMNFHVISESPDCICVYVCQQFLIYHKWEFTLYYGKLKYCGREMWIRCIHGFRRIGKNIGIGVSLFRIDWCPGITEDDDRPPSEPEDCKTVTTCGNFVLTAGESVANLVQGVYKKILTKIFGNKTAEVAAATTTTSTTPTTTTTATTTTTKQAGGTTTAPHHQPGQPPIDVDYFDTGREEKKNIDSLPQMTCENKTKRSDLN